LLPKYKNSVKEYKKFQSDTETLICSKINKLINLEISDRTAKSNYLLFSFNK